MKRCIAYRRSDISRSAWVPCARRAAQGSRFCRSHEDAVDGVVLGLLVNATDSERERVAKGALPAKSCDIRKAS
jgi:hypothetical protein